MWNKASEKECGRPVEEGKRYTEIRKKASIAVKEEIGEDCIKKKKQYIYSKETGKHIIEKERPVEKRAVYRGRKRGKQKQEAV